MKPKVIVSFVIPSFNEEENLELVLETLLKYSDFGDEYETKVVLVDNGSTDRTVDIARAYKIDVLIKPNVNISALRNAGVEFNAGDIYVFLDADVLLTEKWRNNVIPIFQSLIEDPSKITGSHVLPPRSENLFLKYWFGTFAAIEDTTHIGSAHLIMSATLFSRLNGFDEFLETAEDYDICQRGLKAGAKISNDSKLPVIHLGFPTTIRGFVRREMWHGLGDLSSFSSAIRSKSFLASLIFLMAVIIGIVSSAYGVNVAVSFLPLLVFLLLSSYIKFPQVAIQTIIANALIFNFYYAGRLLSMALFARRKLIDSRPLKNNSLSKRE